MALRGQIALVTGASRGIGKGVAVQLGEAGATVYCTGRPEHARSDTSHFDMPSLEATAAEVTARGSQNGGKGIAVYCDHSDSSAVKALFERIETEQRGRLDILVNNAYAAVSLIATTAGQKFYESDPDSSWDIVNNVGLKNYFVCAVYASRLMVLRQSGLIVTVSSFGGLRYLFNVAYGVGKAACDRLAADIAQDLFDKHVTSVSLWPGAVKTELIQQTVLKPGSQSRLKTLFEHGESTDFVGKAIVALASDPNHFAKTGRVLTTEALAKEYNFTDYDGTKPSADPIVQEIRDRYLDHLNELRAPKL